MNKKKVFLAVLALILVCSLSVAGTLAYLTASQAGDDAVVNTFVAAGGGNIIVPSDDNSSFKLVESEATYGGATTGYTLNTANKVTRNEYAMAIPAMVIPKDPTLTVNLESGVEAYIFVKVIDSTSGNITHAVDTSVWKEITVTGLEANAKLYQYTAAFVTGTADTELSNVKILNPESVTVKNVSGVGTDVFTDTDTAKTGIQLGELTFEAYACQAAGFADAATAFTTCFPVNP